METCFISESKMNFNDDKLASSRAKSGLFYMNVSVTMWTTSYWFLGWWSTLCYMADTFTSKAHTRLSQSKPEIRSRGLHSNDNNLILSATKHLPYPLFPTDACIGKYYPRWGQEFPHPLLCIQLLQSCERRHDRGFQSHPEKTAQNLTLRQLWKLLWTKEPPGGKIIFRWIFWLTGHNHRKKEGSTLRQKHHYKWRRRTSMFLRIQNFVSKRKADWSAFLLLQATSGS